MVENITWLGHASFRIQTAAMTIYIDPWNLEDAIPADIILVSHPHYDHASKKDVKALMKPRTLVATTSDTEGELDVKVKAVRPGDVVDGGEVKVRAVSAYNPEKQFHPRSNGWLGFIVEAAGRRVYYAGDTDIIPEMNDLGTIDVALLPVGGTYTMDAEDAARATVVIEPKLAVPCHWGKIVGSKKDADKFKKLAKCPVEVLKSGEKLDF